MSFNLFDEGLITWQSEFAEYDVSDLGSGIAQAQDKPLAFQIGPINEVASCEGVRLRKRYHNSLRPETHMRVVPIGGLAKNDCDVNRTALKEGYERDAVVLENIEIELWMLLTEANDNIAQRTSQRRVKSNTKAARVAGVR